MQATKALESVFAETMPREMGFDYIGLSFQEKKAQEGISPAATKISRAVAVVRFPHPGGLGTRAGPCPSACCSPFPWPCLAPTPPWLSREMENNVFRADRAGHADRSRGQERDPGRGISRARVFELGVPLMEAALVGAMIRLRPILMS